MKWEIEAAIERYLDNKMQTIIAEMGENEWYSQGALQRVDICGIFEKDIERFKRNLMVIIRKALEKETFYVLCDNGTKPPKFRHCGFQSAQKEAQRLTRELGTTARILMEYDVEDTLPF